jgi:hypothetical protein
MQLVFEQLPGVESQQSRSLWQFSVASEHAQKPVSQKLLPQSLSWVQASFAEAKAQVPSELQVPVQQSVSTTQLAAAVTQPQVPPTQGLDPQQSESKLHVPPWSEQRAAHVPSPPHRRLPQQSESLWQEAPTSWQAQVPSAPQSSAPQQSELLLHVLPAAWQAQVPSDPHRSTPQQSALLPHACDVKAHPQVPAPAAIVGFTQRAEQQSLAVVHELPSSAHTPASPPPVPQVKRFGSHRSAPQQSRSVSQRPPVPAQAGAQVPKSQKTEQQSPSVVQFSSSWMQAGTPASVIGWPASG